MQYLVQSKLYVFAVMQGCLGKCLMEIRTQILEYEI